MSTNINDLGFIRVAAASPKMKVADCDYNLQEIKTIIKDAIEQEVQLLCLPELCLTGYTCGDLFFQSVLQKKAVESLIKLVDFLKDEPSIIVVFGLPLLHQNSLYNVAAVVSNEGIMGFIPKKFIPNSNESYEKRWFRSGELIQSFGIEIGDDIYPFSAENTIFETPFGKFGIEIGEELCFPIPHSLLLAMQGADVILNLSASNELVGKNEYRKSLVAQQSGRCNVAYVYASAGCGESTTDLLFSGACYIAENGVILKESKRFSLENEMIISDIDIEALRYDRVVSNNSTAFENLAIIPCAVKPASSFKLRRELNAHPFVPSEEKRYESLGEVFNIQTYGLVKRFMHTEIKSAVIGISGGLDSTLALLVTVKAFDVLGFPRKNIVGFSMPGFGTTERTYSNAVKLMKSLGVSTKVVSIVDAVTHHLNDIEHDITQHDTTYENAQARERTQILMDYSNKINGLVIGTGNLSELALGWATYNGDHMSMYAVNANVPKTLVASLTRWIADVQTDEATKMILYDILDTPFSPELLPADKEGKIAQKTENFVGPYELHDFFLHRMLRYGDEPKRILFIARQAFNGLYTSDEIKKWLQVFYRRFFSQQFKRSCMPDGVKVGSVGLSPRGDWKMPSDAVAKIWTEQLEGL